MKILLRLCQRARVREIYLEARGNTGKRSRPIHAPLLIYPLVNMLGKK